MAQPTNTFDTYDMSGIREQLADIIYNISPTDTPMFSSMGKGKATNTQFKWLTDSLAAASASNFQVEGDDYTATAQTATEEIHNYTQIYAKNFTITGTDDAVDAAGRSTQLAYSLAKNSKELKRDVEAGICQANVIPTVGASNAARKTAGLVTWIRGNSSVGAGGADAAHTNGVPSGTRTDGTQRVFAESMLKEVIRECFVAGGNPDTIMVGPFNKQAISGFTGGSTAIREVPAKTIVAAVDVYQSDFGTLTVKPNRFQRDRDCWIIDSEYWGFNVLRPFQNTQLAKTGDNTHMLLLMEGGVVARNQESSGIVADLTTS